MTPTERLPRRVRVGPFDFKIVIWSPHESHSTGNYGECSTQLATISICREFPTPQKAVDTFLHECLHAIFWAYDIKDEDVEERAVGILATALTALHRDNKWLAPWIEKTVKERA